MWSDLRVRLRALFRRQRVEDELDEELRFHLDHQAESFAAQGLSPSEARRRARLAFGTEKVKEECRDARGVRLIEETLQDLVFAARLLRKSPGFTSSAVLSLALGIGANSSIFAFTDAFLFRSPAIAHAGRLVTIATRTKSMAARPISYPNFLDWRRRNQVFERMAAYRIGAAVLTDGAEAERIPTLQVSSEFFPLLGMAPALGRTFSAREHTPAGDPVVIVSYELWQRRYAGDAAVLGRTLNLSGGLLLTVIGVVPRGFRIGPRADAYVSIDRTADQEIRNSANSLYGIGLLKAGATLEQASLQMDGIARDLEKLYPEANRGQRIQLMPFGRMQSVVTRTPMLTMMGATLFVLLIASANISNLLLARVAGRGHEVAIRKSLGAGRARLIRQLLAEGLLLCSLGGAVGLLFGFWGCRALARLVGDLDLWPPGGEPLGGVHIDLRVLAFTSAIAALAGIAAGLAPALRASRAGLAGALRQSGATGGRKEERLWRDSLVTLEVALALVLLAGTGLMLRSLHYLTTVNPGFDPRHVLTLSFTDGRAWPSDADADALGSRLEAEVEAIPGVEAAAMAFPVPFGHGWSGNSFYIEGRPMPEGGKFPEALVRYVSAQYFKVLGLRLRAGRWFTASEPEKAAVINQRMAREFWPGENPVGQRFSLGGSKPPWFAVVGVAADTRENGLHSDADPQIYLPVAFNRDMLVRTAGDPLALAGAIRSRIRGVDPSQAVYDVEPLEWRISESLMLQRVLSWLLGIFAALALVLAAVGVYGVMAHSASRRTQEVGIRMALGAGPRAVTMLIVRQGMTAVVAGIGLGVVGAWGATRVLAGFLSGVTPADPVTLLAVAALLAAVALAACWLPARRATRINPASAVRSE